MNYVEDVVPLSGLPRYDVAASGSAFFVKPDRTVEEYRGTGIRPTVLIPLFHVERKDERALLELLRPYGPFSSVTLSRSGHGTGFVGFKP